MRNRTVNGAIVAVALVLVVSGCGDDSVLGEGTDTTAPSSTESTATTSGPSDTTEAPPETVATTTTSTTTTTQSVAAQCVSSGGVFAPEEGPDGICFPGGAITAEEYRVWHVNLDDPDGGLIVWTGPGAPNSKVPQEGKYTQAGVIPPYEAGVAVTGHATPDDYWYYVEYADFAGWARSYYLLAVDGEPGLPVCLTGSVGPIPDTAQEVRSLTGNLDGKQGDDTFSIYWNGSDWIAHMRTAYGFHAEMSSGHTGMAPGVGPEVWAGRLWDHLGDGRDEAWVVDNSPATGEVWSTFAWFNNGCRLEHVTHHSTGNVQYWIVGGGVTYIDSMSCDTDGVVHYDGNAVGINDFEGEASAHRYDFEDGVAAEWRAIGGSWFETALGDPMPYGFQCPFP